MLHRCPSRVSKVVAASLYFPRTLCMLPKASGALTFLLCWKTCRARAGAALGRLPRDVARLIAQRIHRTAKEEHERRLCQRVTRPWQQLVQIKPDTGKYRFVQQCRQLPAYGIACFPCADGHELGVTRGSIWELRGPERTVEHEWPLAALMGWAVATKPRLSITLDFKGESRHRTFETDDAEQVAELIVGYLDIARKQTRTGD